MTDEQKKFLELVAGPALQAETRYGIPACVTIAQAILESGWGRSSLFKLAHNPFGIKYVHHEGVEDYGEYVAETKEFADGEVVIIRAGFARYPDPDAAFHAHAQLLQAPRYEAAREARPDWRKFCGALQTCGYSTNPQYAAELQNIVRIYELDVPDTLRKFALAAHEREMGVRTA